MNPTIGIISGSGPEAGIDLWHKVLIASRRRAGPAYSGDLDAPRVVVVSEPLLGLSMDLEAHGPQVWATLEATARQVAEQSDVYGIACNTLNLYAENLESLNLDSELISVQAVAAQYISSERLPSVGLLGARDVNTMGPLSAYRGLGEITEVITPQDPDDLHELVLQIKRSGPATPGLRKRFHHIIKMLDVEPVLLACTELPLLEPPDDVEVVDVSALLADALVSHPA
ncbi:MAG: aspartate/glutamate racemase family protein [Acidimicrobiales bacterium]